VTYFSGFSVGCCINKKRLSVTNLSPENNLPTFRLNAPVIIGTKVMPWVHFFHFCSDDHWSIQSKRRQVIFRAQVCNR